MHHAPGSLTHVAEVLEALGRLHGSAIRLWRPGPARGELVAGPAAPDGWAPAAPQAAGAVAAPHGAVWLSPLGNGTPEWLEVADAAVGQTTGPALVAVVASLRSAEQETAQVAAELSERYEEIDLIYSIGEILGQTIRLEEAAQRILSQVAHVVGARRATLLVADGDRGVLRLVAAQGMNPSDVEALEFDDPTSVAARAFREQRIIAYDPRVPDVSPGRPAGRNYRGRAFLSVPVTYVAPGRPPRPIGVINLTDRQGEDAFSTGDRKLVAAIANQIGAAIENARLVARDQAQQRLRRELELAHDLQLKLLPSPLVIAARCDVAARCRSADSVGGDLYNLMALRDGRIGAMIGDVSSHGFGAALIMALVIAASGIHAETVDAPADVLQRLERSLADELARTEMFLTLFYAVIDPNRATITYANAGHPHAFLVAGDTGATERLGATRPPLGMGAEMGTDVTRPWRVKRDILCLFTDGIAEAQGATEAHYGEARILGHVSRLRARPAREILDAIYTDLAAFTEGSPARDDRTLVLLRA